jgi:hypothetical protein
MQKLHRRKCAHKIFLAALCCLMMAIAPGCNVFDLEEKQSDYIYSDGLDTYRIEKNGPLNQEAAIRKADREAQSNFRKDMQK